MIVIRETPVYITREMCDDAGIDYNGEQFCYAALIERDICGYCVFKMSDDTAVILYATAPAADILDGVVRAAIAGGEEKGAKYYDFDIPQSVSEKLLPLGFRKSISDKPHSIEKLFSVCKGCAKKENEDG